MTSFAKRTVLLPLATLVLLSGPAAGQERRPSAMPKLYNTAKQKLLDGKQINGHSIGRFDPKGYCEAAPHYDFTWFEMQHSTMIWADIAKMIAECPRAGAIPMIRMPDELESSIQHATDLGVLGIIMPTVDTVEKAIQTARYARYPPVGRRSQGGGQHSRIWGVNGINYRQTFNDNMLVVLMIETPVGVANAYEIARVPGIDAVIVGTSDLSNFSGYPASHPRYQQMLADVRDGVIKAGKWFGTASAEYREGHPLSKDVMFTQHGPSKDGWQPPTPPGGAGKKGGKKGGQ